MSKVHMAIEDAAAVTIHHLIQQMRGLEVTQKDPELDARLRDAELSLAGALRSVGWEPRPGGGWQMRGGGRQS